MVHPHLLLHSLATDHLVLCPNTSNTTPEKIADASEQMLGFVLRHIGALASADMRKEAAFFYGLFQKVPPPLHLSVEIRLNFR